jgi:competence protein ComEC
LVGKQIPHLWLNNYPFFWCPFQKIPSAQIAVAPLSVFYFNQFPGLFLLSNWFILPFFGLYLIGSMCLVVLMALNIEIQLLTIGYDKIENSLNDSILWIANQEGFLFQNMRLSVYLLIAIYLLLSFVYWSLKFHKIKYLIGALASFLIIQLIVLFEQWENSKINQLWLLYQQNQNRPPRTQKTDALQSAKNY